MYIKIFTFPFRQIGDGLRELSLSGTMGNILAFALYSIISAIPILYLVWRIRKQQKNFCAEDLLLPLLSAMMAVTLYLMINPGKMNSWVALGDGVAYCTTIYSILVGWLAMKVILKIPAVTEKNLVRNFRVGLIILGVILAAGSVLGVFTSLLPGIDKLYANDSYSVSAIGSRQAYLSDGGDAYEQDWSDGNLHNGMVVFLWIKYIISQIPIILDVLVISMAVRLTRHLEKDRYGEAVLVSTQKLGKVCIVAAIVMVLKPILLNLGQLFMGSMVPDAAYQTEIPILSIVLVMAVYLLSRYFSKDKELKEEHDLII